jgi:hypothetical protein
VDQVARRVLGVGVDVQPDTAADAGALQDPMTAASAVGSAAAAMAASSVSSGCTPRCSTASASRKLA